MSLRPLLTLPVLLLALAACGADAAPSASPANLISTGGRSTPAPTLGVPAASAAVSTSSPGAAEVATAPVEPEAALIHGARLDLQGKCVTLRTDLPAGALGAIECTPASDVAARASMVVFDTQAQLLDAYWANVEAQGIEPRTNGGRCEPGVASEGGYVPGDGHPGLEPVERGACWIDADGYGPLRRDPAAVHPAAGRRPHGLHDKRGGAVRMARQPGPARRPHAVGRGTAEPREVGVTGGSSAPASRLDPGAVARSDAYSGDASRTDQAR